MGIHPKILMLVDPAARSQPALERAAQLALREGGSIELYVCDVEQGVPERWAGSLNAHEYRALLRERRLEMLEALAQPLRARGLIVTTRSEWHAPLEEGLLRHLSDSKPDLVIYHDAQAGNIAAPPAAAVAGIARESSHGHGR